MTRVHGVRRTGSAALDLAWVACGRMDGFWEFGLKPWDVAAGSLLVQEAGGRVTNMDGTRLGLSGGADCGHQWATASPTHQHHRRDLGGGRTPPAGNQHNRAGNPGASKAQSPQVIRLLPDR